MSKKNNKRNEKIIAQITNILEKLDNYGLVEIHNS